MREQNSNTTAGATLGPLGRREGHNSGPGKGVLPDGDIILTPVSLLQEYNPARSKPSANGRPFGGGLISVRRE